MRLNDPALVRAEYEDERRLALRQAAHRAGEEPDALVLVFRAVAEARPERVVFRAVAEARPERVLDVGCGPGGARGADRDGARRGGRRRRPVTADGRADREARRGCAARRPPCRRPAAVPSREAARTYVDAAVSIDGTLPPSEGPLRLRRTPVVFVAEKA